MDRRRLRVSAGLLALMCAAVPAVADEPRALDLRAPAAVSVPPAAATQLRMDVRPGWVQRLDHMARHGLGIVCLRQKSDTRWVLGAHPDGYIGVFVMPADGVGRHC